MIPLVANTVAQLIKPEKRNRYLKISSDSTTLTRIGKTEVSIETGNGGFGITAYESVVVLLPFDEALFAVSTGTPNISIAEVKPETAKDVIRVN